MLLPYSFICFLNILKKPNLTEESSLEALLLSEPILAWKLRPLSSVLLNSYIVTALCAIDIYIDPLKVKNGAVIKDNRI